jgi:lipopolysaccharide biosynthesis glycosyltransferase
VWLRCLLADLLPEVDRVLYLDADILVCSPLDALFSIDLGAAPLAAAPNVVQPADRSRILQLGIDDYRRFLNAGVLLMDLQRLRAENASTALMEVAATTGEDLQWADQDALNVVFADRWHVLHPRWNAQNTLWTASDVADDVLGSLQADQARRSPAILHFEGPTLCKPWHALNTHPWRDEWWATLARTPWAETPAEDRGAATAALRLLPEAPRIWIYRRLIGWRARRSVTS